MDLNDLRNIFGEMPIEYLNSAEALKKIKNRRNLIIAGLVSSVDISV